MNAIGVIAPYKYEGMWVFDDPAVGLSREPFVSGIDTMIDRLVAQIPDAEKGFRLLFSATPFPGYTVKLVWRREEYGGNCSFPANYANQLASVSSLRRLRGLRQLCEVPRRTRPSTVSGSSPDRR